jgi:hypothetical protein
MAVPAPVKKPATKTKRPASPRKGIALGDRVTVAVGKDKNGHAIYSYMLKSVATYFGLTALTSTPTKNNKFGDPIPSRGSKGGGSIKIPINQRTAVKIPPPPKSGSPAQHHKPPAPKSKTTVKITKRILSMPMPAGMTIAKIAQFLKTATKNKPTEFISSRGRTHPVPQK